MELRGNLSMTLLPLWSAMCYIYREKKNPRAVLRLNLSVLWHFSTKCDLLQWRGTKRTYLLSVLRFITVQLIQFIFSVCFDYFSFSLYFSYSSERVSWDVTVISWGSYWCLIWYNGASSAVGNIGRFFLQDVNCSLPVYFCGLLVNCLWHQSW